MIKILKKIGKVLGILFVVLMLIAIFVYVFVLQYPNIKENPKIGKWYRVGTNFMKDSEGNKYHALFRKGKENKVLIYFAGGGVSINEETAKNDTYNTKEVKPDMLANITMNMGGLASDVDGNPYKEWSLILFPYATGDFHCGTGEFKYMDSDGKEKILYHNGYINYTETMDKIINMAGLENVDTVLVTGYSAGGFATALLSDDIFTNYFPNAINKNVLVDAALLLNDEWHSIAKNVWKTPKEISDKLVSNNLTLDCFKSLNDKYGDGIHLMFDCSTRDGDLAKVQNYLDDGIMDVDEKQADEYQKILKETIPQFQELNVSLFIWDGMKWYDDPRNMTAHTIISTPAVWLPFEGEQKSVAEWLQQNIQDNPIDYGLYLVNKIYE